MIQVQNCLCPSAGSIEPNLEYFIWCSFYFITLIRFMYIKYVFTNMLNSELSMSFEQQNQSDHMHASKKPVDSLCSAVWFVLLFSEMVFFFCNEWNSKQSKVKQSIGLNGPKSRMKNDEETHGSRQKKRAEKRQSTTNTLNHFHCTVGMLTHRMLSSHSSDTDFFFLLDAHF